MPAGLDFTNVHSSVANALKSAGTVLVADDLHVNLHGLRQLLAAQGYEVLIAKDGEEALAIAARELPDIVLTDIRMPKRMVSTSAASCDPPRRRG